MKFNLELSPLTILLIVIIIILIIGNIFQAIGSYSRMGLDDLYDDFRIWYLFNAYIKYTIHHEISYCVHFSVFLQIMEGNRQRGN